MCEALLHSSGERGSSLLFLPSTWLDRLVGQLSGVKQEVYYTVLLQTWRPRKNLKKNVKSFAGLL